MSLDRAQCSICTELFEKDSVISAVPCGHTFHDHCLLRWGSQSKTCPQCRVRFTMKNFIKQLFFTYDADDGNAEGSGDIQKLQNEYAGAKAALQQLRKDKKDLCAEKEEFKEKIQELKDKAAQKDKTLLLEKSKGSALKKELTYLRDVAEDGKLAREEANELRAKFERMRSVEKILTGCEEEVDEVLSRNGADPKQMATWCAVLRQELASKRQEARSLRVDAEKHKKMLAIKKEMLISKTQDLVACREQMKGNEEDLKASERECLSLQKKIGNLEKALGSPSVDTATSFARRLIHESPAPFPSAKRPKLSSDGLNGDIEVDLDVTLDLFPSPQLPAKPSPATQTKTECKEYGTQFVKITSAAGKRKPSGGSSQMNDISNITGLSNFSLFKKSSVTGNSSSLIRQGYNGMGGYEKFMQPSSSRAKAAPKKSASIIMKQRAKGLGSLPKLPTLPSFD